MKKFIILTLSFVFLSISEGNSFYVRNTSFSTIYVTNAQGVNKGKLNVWDSHKIELTWGDFPIKVNYRCKVKGKNYAYTGFSKEERSKTIKTPGCYVLAGGGGCDLSAENWCPR